MSTKRRAATAPRSHHRSPQRARHAPLKAELRLPDPTETRRLTEACRIAEAERQRLEIESAAARARSDLKDKFFAAVSHELRHPLTPVLTAAMQLGQLDGLPDEARRLIDTICRNAELQSRLIDDLLDIIRIGRDKLHVEFRVLDLHALIREVIGSCRADAEAKHLVVTFDAGATTARVAGDPLRLRQVFWNLLRNAVKYTPAGGHIRIVSSHPSAGVIRVAVVDSGIGIAPQALPQLFRPFEQIAPRASEGGLGLGLAIARGIVDAHHGQLCASSPGPGLGATFEIDLSTVDAEVVMPAAPPAMPATGPGPLRILVVEDHQDSADMLVMLLGSVGHHVERVATVAEALRAAHDRWDVVMSDLGLPDGSGCEVGRAFRAVPYPPRLIALSGYGTATDLELSREAGFDLHLVKPMDVARILDALRTVAPNAS